MLSMQSSIDWALRLKAYTRKMIITPTANNISLKLLNRSTRSLIVMTIYPHERLLAVRACIPPSGSILATVAARQNDCDAVKYTQFTDSRCAIAYNPYWQLVVILVFNQASCTGMRLFT